MNRFMMPKVRFSRDETPKRPEAKPSSRRTTIFGLDLGKKHDYAALACLDDLRADLPTPTAPWDDMRRCTCVATKRWPLDTSYMTIIEDVKGIVARDGWRDPVLVTDASGVGQPVIDAMRKERLACRVVPVTIVGGNSQRVDAEGYWWVAKSILVSGAKVALQRGELRVAAKEKALLEELSNYTVKVTGGGNEVYNAPEGEHDDLVMALCLAIWYAYNGQRRMMLR